MQSSLFSPPFIDLKGDLSETDVIAVYGIDEGAIYRQLRSWLQQQEQRFLLFIEEDEERFLKMKETSWAKDPKVRFYFYQEEDEELFKEIAWEFLFLKFGFLAAPDDLDRKREKMIAIFSTLEHYHRAIDLIASDFQDMGVKVIRNLLNNRVKLTASSLGQSLEGACRGIPAIICGAGPSLNSQLPLLGSLRDRALLFAGGSAVAALSRHQIAPHFCAHFDPDPPRDRFLLQDVAEVPHFYQSRFSHALLSYVHAPLIWIAEGGNYPIEKWLRERYQIPYPSFDAGWTVANFCTALAILLGCNPIIFVGMEFSTSVPQVYAGELSAREHGDAFLEAQDQEGRVVLTKQDWMMSANWQSQLAKKYPHLQFFNATPQGLSMGDVEKISLESAIDSHLDRQFDLAGAIHSLLQRAPRPSSEMMQNDDLHSTLHTSLSQCGQICDQLIKLWEKSYPRSPLETPAYAVLEHDLEKEMAFPTLLDPLWQVWKRPILRASNHPLGNHLHRLLFFKRAIDDNLRALS